MGFTTVDVGLVMCGEFSEGYIFSIFTSSFTCSSGVNKRFSTDSLSSLSKLLAPAGC